MHTYNLKTDNISIGAEEKKINNDKTRKKENEKYRNGQ